LSLDQSNKSDSPNGKKTPAMILPLMAKTTLTYYILEMPKDCAYFAS